MTFLGIDIGGSAVKGALVDTQAGKMGSKRHRIETDEICTPKRMTKIVNQIVEQFEYSGPVGIGFPAPIRNRVAELAANIHPDWVGKDVYEMFQQRTNLPCYVLNDADAAGLAEMRFGAGRECLQGVVLMTTLGTGIGSAIFVNGELLPNTEFGHLQVRGKDAEQRASDAIRQKKKLTWEEWAQRLQEYFDWMEMLISPDLIVIGGGVSKQADKFLPYLRLKAEVKPAMLRNEAGIIGAACFAADQLILKKI